MATKSSTVEATLAEWASRSHGVVTRQEMLGAGVSKAELLHRVKIGILIPIHRGVFRVGHQSPSLLARYMAAVKACGPGSLLAGRAAGHLLGLLKRPPSLPEVLAPTQRRIKGVRTHRVRRNELTDGTRWRGNR